MSRSANSYHRILFTDHATAVGGAENSLLLLAAHLDKEHWQLMLAGAAGIFASEAETQGIAVHALPMPRLRRSPGALAHWVQTARRLSSLARQHDISLLHANTVRAAFYTSLAAKLAQRPFIWHMRDFWLSESRPAHPWLDTLLKRLLMASATVVIANSQATAGHLPASSKIRLVPNGINLAQFDPAQSGAPFRQAFGIPLTAPLVGMIGRLRPWKGQQRFLQIAASIHAAIPSTYFAIIGGDPFAINDDYARTLKATAQKLPFARQIIFPGQMTDVVPALAALDVFVHPGDPEPFGLVNVEAMAMAKPIVAFAHGALPEIVVHEQTGCLTPPNDTAVAAKAILSLLNHPGKARELGQNGRRRAETHFDIRRAVREVEAIYQEILAS